ncbi:MAG: hypothetical protein WKG07_41420 [Hymenobacter sp.]
MASTAAFLSADGYHHHIGLNTWHSQGGRPAPREGVAGLYHAAILYPGPGRAGGRDPAPAGGGLPLNGASDHGVSEAIYLDDPDGNGLELYWDRPRAEWPTPRWPVDRCTPTRSTCRGCCSLVE